jgi:hypothetical protein
MKSFVDKTDKSFSSSAFAEHVNKCVNNTDKKHADASTAMKTFLEKTIKKLGCHNQDELHDVVSNAVVDATPIADQIPSLVSSFMVEEGRKFEIPSLDDKTAKAAIGIREIPEKTKTGITRFGANKGASYETTISAHNEIYVKNYAKIFKK